MQCEKNISMKKPKHNKKWRLVVGFLNLWLTRIVPQSGDLIFINEETHEHLLIDKSRMLYFALRSEKMFYIYM